MLPNPSPMAPSKRRLKHTITLFFLILTHVLVLNAQQTPKIDSLIQRSHEETSAAAKIKLYNKIAQLSPPKDSLQKLAYIQKSMKLSEETGLISGTIGALLELGYFRIKKGEYQLASKQYLNITSLAGDSLLQQKAKAYNNLGILAYLQDKDSSALVFHKKSLAIKQQIKDTIGIAKSQNNIGLLYEELGQHNKALYFYEQSIKTKKLRNDKKGLCFSYLNIGVIHQNKGDYQLALDTYLKALNYAEDIKNASQIAMCNTNIGIVYSKLGDKNKAIAYYRASLAYEKEQDNKKGIAANLNNIGAAYYDLGRYPEGLEHYLQSSKILSAIPDTRGLTINYNNIGSIYNELMLFTDALHYFKKGLELAKKSEHKGQTPLLYNNIANTYASMKKFDQALENYQYSLQAAEKLENKESIAVNLIDLGQHFLDTNQLKKAISHAEKGLALSQQIDFKSNIAEAYILAGRIAWRQKNLTKAQQLLERGIALAHTIQNVTNIKLGAQILVAIHKAQGNYKGALQRLETFHTLYDSLLGKEKNLTIAGLKIKHETEIKEQEIVNLNQEAAIKELQLSESKLKTTALIITVLVLLLLGIVLVLIYQQKQFKLTQKNRDIEQNLLRVQMNPHFIFNAMAAIQDYIDSGAKEKAGLYLAKFAKLIRQVLDNSRNQFVPLEQEIKMLDNYLAIQNLRRAVPFNYHIDVDEAIFTDEIAIPPMFAQPFVENAIEHGIASLGAEATITISFSLKDDLIILAIEDNGIGITALEQEIPTNHTSHAMAITKERIDLLKKRGYKESYFKVHSLATGTRVQLQLPSFTM